MARNYNKSIMESLNKSAFRGGLKTREEQIRDFYQANKTKLEPELISVTSKKGVTVSNFEDYFVSSVLHRAPLTSNADLAMQETYNDLVTGKISNTEANKRIKQIRSDNIENISKSEFHDAVSEAIVLDTYRSWGVDNYMETWFATLDPKQFGRKTFGGKYSKEMKQMMKDTGWRGTKEDWLSLEWDASINSFIYTNVKQKTDKKTGKITTTITKWRFYFHDSPRTADYEEV